MRTREETDGNLVYRRKDTKTVLRWKCRSSLISHFLLVVAGASWWFDSFPPDLKRTRDETEVYVHPNSGKKEGRTIEWTGCLVSSSIYSLSMKKILWKACLDFACKRGRERNSKTEESRTGRERYFSLPLLFVIHVMTTGRRQAINRPTTFVHPIIYEVKDMKDQKNDSRKRRKGDRKE